MSFVHSTCPIKLTSSWVLYNPYDEALFSDYQDHLSEEAYHNHLRHAGRSQGHWTITAVPHPCLPGRSVAATGGLARTRLPLLTPTALGSHRGLHIFLIPCRTVWQAKPSALSNLTYSLEELEHGRHDLSPAELIEALQEWAEYHCHQVRCIDALISTLHHD